MHSICDSHDISYVVCALDDDNYGKNSWLELDFLENYIVYEIIAVSVMVKSVMFSRFH